MPRPTHRRPDLNRQARYEQFLDGVQESENKAIVAALPECLETMVGLINEAKTTIGNCQDYINDSGVVFLASRTKANWNDKTLPRLRLMYKRAKDVNVHARDRLVALEEMATLLNSWWRRFDWRIH